MTTLAGYASDPTNDDSGGTKGYNLVIYVVSMSPTCLRSYFSEATGFEYTSFVKVA